MVVARCHFLEFNWTLMNTLIRRFALGLLILPLGFGMCARVFAQSGDYPVKPIRIVVTFPPGGSTDTMVRMLSPPLE